jgi:hypothetical protein
MPGTQVVPLITALASTEVARADGTPSSSHGSGAAPSASVVPPPPGASDGDIVEEIIDSAPQAQARPVRAANATDAPRFQVAGWVRQSMESYPVKPPEQVPALTVPRDSSLLQTQLFGRFHYNVGRHFELTGSGLFTYTLHHLWPEDRIAADESATYLGTYEASLRELYVGLYSKTIDIRLGQMRVAWGKGELMSPNDIVNAVDRRDPFFSEPETRHIPTPMARVDAYLGSVSLQGIFEPFFVPDAADVYGTNWAAIQPSAPSAYRGFARTVSNIVDPTLRPVTQPLLQQTQLPGYDLSHPQAGARVSTSISGVDLDGYYFWGYDSSPALAVSLPFAAQLQQVNWTTASISTLTSGLTSGAQPFSATYVPRHHVGADAATTVGQLAVRADAAYDDGRVFYTQAFESVVSPAVQGVLSLEYQTGEPDKSILLEAMALHRFDRVSATGTLFFDRTSYGAGVVARWMLMDHFVPGVIAMLGVEPWTYVLKPSFEFLYDRWTVGLTGLLLGGETWSFGDYFGYNDSVMVSVRLAF